jgi:hypothetical protein
MKRITEYTTARGSTIKDLDARVAEFIQRGLQPFGSPYTMEGDEPLACQAMVRYEPEAEAVIR